MVARYCWYNYIQLCIIVWISSEKCYISILCGLYCKKVGNKASFSYVLFCMTNQVNYCEILISLVTHLTILLLNILQYGQEIYTFLCNSQIIILSLRLVYNMLVNQYTLSNFAYKNNKFGGTNKIFMESTI